MVSRAECHLKAPPPKQTAKSTFCLHAAFPLIFSKHSQRSGPLDKDGSETLPEADSDFEEITSAEKQTVCHMKYILYLLKTHSI